jgi:hypothetical protein
VFSPSPIYNVAPSPPLMDCTDLTPTASTASTLPPADEDERRLLLLDWDDTMLCSHYLARHGITIDKVRGGAVPPGLDRLGRGVALTLGACLALADRAVMVTNAERGWVELSCKTFLPCLWPLVEGIRTISARSTYEQEFAAQPAMWKQLAFTAEVEGYLRDRGHGLRALHVISIGDSIHERMAVKRVCAGLRVKGGPVVYCKSVKMLDKPSLDQLVREHDLLHCNIADVIRRAQDLDLFVKVDDPHPHPAAAAAAHDQVN